MPSRLTASPFAAGDGPPVTRFTVVLQSGKYRFVRPLSPCLKRVRNADRREANLISVNREFQSEKFRGYNEHGIQSCEPPDLEEEKRFIVWQSAPGNSRWRRVARQNRRHRDAQRESDGGKVNEMQTSAGSDRLYIAGVCVKRVRSGNKRKINARTNTRPTTNKIVPLAW